MLANPNPAIHDSLEGNKNARSNAYTGNLALQLINGIIKIVNNLSRLFGIVRVARMAGIAQANPDNIGTNDRPLRPIFDNGLSINIAPRAK